MRTFMRAFKNFRNKFLIEKCYFNLPESKKNMSKRTLVSNNIMSVVTLPQRRIILLSAGKTHSMSELNKTISVTKNNNSVFVN